MLNEAILSLAISHSQWALGSYSVAPYVLEQENVPLDETSATVPDHDSPGADDHGGRGADVPHVGDDEGKFEGGAVGRSVGGRVVGSRVGLWVGACVTTCVGACVGASVGLFVKHTAHDSHGVQAAT